VTLITEGLLEFSKQQISRNGSFNLRYPTGERLPVKFKVRVLIEVGVLSMDNTSTDNLRFMLSI